MRWLIPNLARALLTRSGLLLLVILSAGCYLRDIRWSPIRPPSRADAREYVVVTTGYCPCGECCGWRRNWFGRAVIASGPNAGKPKEVGITASGAPARHGTIAADTTIFPFGTIMHIPGYGYGRVEDRGGDITGYHIDLYYSTHGRAQQHGRYKERIRVWFPPGFTPPRVAPVTR